MSTHEPRVHDFARVRCWGHDFTIRSVEKGGELIRGSLWTSWMLRVGDWLILPNGERSTRYRVTEVEPAMDPADMYHYVAAFAPRAL